MSDELSDLYQEVILHHSRKPRNFHVLAEATHSAEGKNPLCGDHFTVFLKLQGGVIRDISFQGAGCAISTASASLMTEDLKGKTAAQAQKVFEQYQQMVTTGPTDAEAMGKLSAFTGVRRFPMRVKCAILPWHAMMAGLKGDALVSTEEK
jgi:nitrogen fixation NifU-like protein